VKSHRKIPQEILPLKILKNPEKSRKIPKNGINLKRISGESKTTHKETFKNPVRNPSS